MPDSPVAHVIDDDDALRDSLSFLLASADIPVVTYASATAFLKALPDISIRLRRHRHPHAGDERHRAARAPASRAVRRSR